MDEILLIGLFILVFVGLPIGLGLLLYFIPKKFGHPKTGKYLTIIFGVFILSIVLWTAFEDQLFTKNNAKELVEEQQIFLKDKFDLQDNKSMSAIGDYYHTFTLKISARDKQNAIFKIKNSDNFKTNNSSVKQMLYLSDKRYFGSKVTQNYETSNAFVKRVFPT
ncbi:hypothetical protein [Kaistella soli]|uniref:hypothetical protein n=1 Tax=Kaistella soli TaxID=2849654 RepID=UPI001FE391EB|nr:hypothetical protein [Kaistella soli]